MRGMKLLIQNFNIAAVEVWELKSNFIPQFTGHVIIYPAGIKVNSLRPSDAYMLPQPRTALVEIMACRLFGAKPLSEPMLEYCQFDPWEQTSVKF